MAETEKARHPIDWQKLSDRILVVSAVGISLAALSGIAAWAYFNGYLPNASVERDPQAPIILESEGLTLTQSADRNHLIIQSPSDEFEYDFELTCAQLGIAHNSIPLEDDCTETFNQLSSRIYIPEDGTTTNIEIVSANEFRFNSSSPTISADEVSRLVTGAVKTHHYNETDFKEDVFTAGYILGLVSLIGTGIMTAIQLFKIRHYRILQELASQPEKPLSPLITKQPSKSSQQAKSSGHKSHGLLPHIMIPTPPDWVETAASAVKIARAARAEQVAAEQAVVPPSTKLDHLPLATREAIARAAINRAANYARADIQIIAGDFIDAAQKIANQEIKVSGLNQNIDQLK